jgi:hypothetical protein
MADDKSKRGSQDRARINLDQQHEIDYWTDKFGVTPEQLRDAIGKVGNSAEAVERELEKAA